MRHILFVAVLASGYLTLYSGAADRAPGSSVRSPDPDQSPASPLALSLTEVVSPPLLCTPPPGCRCVGHTFICM
jgi:hypothetical protein